MRSPGLFVIFALAAALSGRPLPAVADLSGHGGMVRAIDVSPDGHRAFTGSFDFSAIVWDFGTQTEIGRLDEHAGPVTAVAFAPDGKRALTASDDMTAIVWNLETLEPIHRLAGHKHKVMAVAVSADGRLAATGSWDKTVRIWDLRTGAVVREIYVATPVNTIAFLGASTKLAIGGHDPVIRLVDAATGLRLGKFEGHRMGITQLATSADGGQLISASIDKTLRLWNLREPTEVRVYEGHDGQVFAARFSADGETALSAGRDGVLVQWDLASGRQKQTIDAHDAIIWGLGVSPDGRFALTASSDETVRVWHLGTGDRIGIEAAPSDEPKPWLTSDHPGASLFGKCAKCHSLSANGARRSGPHLSGLFGRRAGSVPDYKYSSALTGADFVWNERTLFRLFDEGPDKVLPGTKMPVQRVTDSQRLAQLVEYLKELTAQ